MSNPQSKNNPAPQAKRIPKEYWCHYCHEWLESAYCQGHFETAHGQKDVTFEALEKRLAALGGLETRDAAPEEPDPSVEQKPRSWMWRDDKDDQSGTFVTNNFRHQLK